MGVIKNDVGRPSNKTIMIRKVIKVVLLLIFVSIVFYVAYKMNNKNNLKKTNIKTTTPVITKTEKEIKNYTVSYDGKKDDKYYVYNNTETNYYNYLYGKYISYGVFNEEYKDDDYKLIGSYTCKSDGCKNLTINVVNDFMVIYDENKYFVYDYKKDKIVKYLNIDDIKYEYIVPVNKNNNIVGVILTNDDYNNAYYDLSKEEIVLDYGLYYINYDSNSIESNYLYLSKEKDIGVFEHKLYDFTKNKIIDKEVTDIIKGKKVTYYLNSDSDFDTYDKIYDENFNIIYSSKTEDDFISIETFYLQDNDNLVISYNDIFYVYDTNYKVKYKSIKYKKVYNVVKDYVVVNKDNRLTLVDYKGNTIVDWVKLDNNMNVHYMLSGWFTQDGKNGIYVVVEDPSADCSKAVKNVTGGELDCDNPLGYEYYYIPKTKEHGKLDTIIGGYAKPVLYLYPKEDNTKVTVSFEKEELLTTTYPKFNKKWEVTANKNGDLYDSNGRYYYGLYWEEKGSNKVDFSTGFYVTKDNALEFLEDKLSLIGLNEREANEFIMYWLPILEKNKKNLVYFELTEKRDSYNKININPKPDSILRMAIHVKKVNKKVNIKQQQFTKFERYGFTVVEWGGVNY